MKFRIESKYNTTLPRQDITTEQFIVSAKEACDRLKWNIRSISPYGIVAYTPGSMNSWSEVITIRIENEIIMLNSECLGNQLHDWGKNKKNLTQFTEAFFDIKATLSTEDAISKYDVLKADFPAEEDDILNPETYAESQKKSGFIHLFIPREGYYITPIIIILNILVFIIMSVSGASVMMPDAETIYKWGGNYGAGTLNGEWWRIFSCVFVHIGIIHLLMNMYALMYIGLFLEPMLGKIRYLSAYLLTGVCASILSLYIHPDIVSAGASGAIFGMYGIFLAMLVTNLVDKSLKKAILPSILIFVFYNLASGTKSGVDNAGHIGGLIGGLIMGLVCYPSIKKPENKKLSLITLSGMSLLVFIATIFSFSKTTNSQQVYESGISRYQKNFEKFAELESKALSIYSLGDTATNGTMMDFFKGDGMRYWEQCEKLLTENDSIDLPEQAVNVNRQLKYYVSLRKQVFELEYKKISENTDVYMPKINELNKEINDLIDKLTAEKK